MYKGTFARWENISSLKRMPYEVMRNSSNVFVIRTGDKVKFEGWKFQNMNALPLLHPLSLSANLHEGCVTPQSSLAHWIIWLVSLYCIDHLMVMHITFLHRKTIEKYHLFFFSFCGRLKIGLFCDSKREREREWNILVSGPDQPRMLMTGTEPQTEHSSLLSSLLCSVI